jgi:hypothetical protein
MPAADTLRDRAFFSIDVTLHHLRSLVRFNVSHLASNSIVLLCYMTYDLSLQGAGSHAAALSDLGIIMIDVSFGTKQTRQKTETYVVDTIS